MSNKITQKELKELLHYGPETGIFVWKVSPTRSVHVGDVAGTIHHLGYREIKIGGRLYRAHRLAWLYVYGKFPDDQIDHINQDPGDNRITNLRDATASKNQRNARMNKANTSGVMGVCWSKSRKKWYAQITVDGKQKYLGSYKNIELAAV